MNVEEKALGFVLGSLSPGERDEVARERLYNNALDREVRSLERLYASLPSTEPDAPPPPDLWSQIRGSLEREQSELAGKHIEECGSGEWQPHGAGIEFKPLWSQKAILIRCNPGAVEERHDQPSDEDEHIIVLAGDLNIGGRAFGLGDYIRVPAGTIHERMSSTGGCILFTEYAAAG